MVLSYISGEFAIGTATGNLTVDTGGGFDGKIIRFIWTRQTAAGASAGYSGGEGWAVSSTQRCCLAWAGDDAVGTTNTGRAFDSTRCIRMFSNGTPTQDGNADFVSFGTGADTGKFTINRATAFGVSALVKFEMWGGSDITNVKIASFTGPAAAATGAKEFTGVGFQAKYLRILAASKDETAETTGAAHMKACIGQAVSLTSRQVSAWSDRDATTHSTNAEGVMDNTKCLFIYTVATAGSDTSDNVADFGDGGSNGFTSDGFWLNYTKVTTGSVLFFGILMGGTFQVALGQTARPTATGDQDVTSPGFDLTGLSTIGGAPTANATETALMYLIQGGGEATGTVRDDAVCCAAQSTINTQDDMRTIDTKIYVQIGDTGTIIAEADLTAWITNGFRLNWPTVDANARLYQWTAWGSEAVAPEGDPLLGALATVGVGK